MIYWCDMRFVSCPMSYFVYVAQSIFLFWYSEKNQNKLLKTERKDVAIPIFWLENLQKNHVLYFCCKTKIVAQACVMFEKNYLYNFMKISCVPGSTFLIGVHLFTPGTKMAPVLHCPLCEWPWWQ